MVLYIDETENEDFFFVTGLLADSKTDVDRAYRQFKKAVHNYPIAPRYKQEVFREFKSFLLDRRFQRIKNRKYGEVQA